MKGATGKVISGLIGAAAVALSPSAFAQEQAHKFYLGGAYGQTKLAGGCDDVRDAFSSLGGTTSSCSDKDNGWKIFGGYQVNRNFAVEASYIDWGAINGSGRVGAIPVNVTGEAQSFGVAAVGILPLNERFSVFGKAGILMTDTKVSARATSGALSSSSSEDDSSSELHIGVGALFNVSESFAIRAEWERATDTKIDMISIGVQVRF
jgi:OOP family OmpA-OmpF porin